MSFKSIYCLRLGELGRWPPAFTPTNRAERLFALKVQPLLKDKCLGCHGGDSDDIKGEFSVLSREALLRGGESEEAAIVPGKPDEGTLVSAIQWESLEMPPKENDRLTEQQIEMVRKWIKQGAPWPDEKTQSAYREEEAKQRVTDEGMIVDTSGGTSEQWTNRRYPPEDLWAFLPVKSKSELLPPNVARNKAIDHFIDAKLDEAGITRITARRTPRI